MSNVSGSSDAAASKSTSEHTGLVSITESTLEQNIDRLPEAAETEDGTGNSTVTTHNISSVTVTEEEEQETSGRNHSNGKEPGFRRSFRIKTRTERLNIKSLK